MEYNKDNIKVNAKVNLEIMLDYYYYKSILPDNKYNPVYNIKDQGNYINRITYDNRRKITANIKYVFDYINVKLYKYNTFFLGLITLNAFNFLTLIKEAIINTNNIEKRFKYIFNQELFNNADKTLKSRPLKDMLRVNSNIKLFGVNSLVYSTCYLSLFHFYNQTDNEIFSYAKMIFISLFCSQIPGIIQKNYLKNYFNTNYPLLKETFIYLYRKDTMKQKFKLFLNDVKKTYSLFLLENVLSVLMLMKLYDILNKKLENAIQNNNFINQNTYTANNKKILKDNINNNDTLNRIYMLYLDRSSQLYNRKLGGASLSIITSFLAGSIVTSIITPLELFMIIKNRENLKLNNFMSNFKEVSNDTHLSNLYTSIGVNLLKVNCWKYILQFGSCYTFLKFIIS